MYPIDFERMRRKQLRRSFSTIGWILLLYYLIMNAAVIFVIIAESLVDAMKQIMTEDFRELTPSTGDLGYVIATVIGLMILLLWKKPRFWKQEIWARGKPMTPGSFLCILCLFLSGQFFYQIVTVSVETVLNFFGLTMMEELEALSLGSDSFMMFLYASILAPITEEILFRGLIQRTLLPYGKKFAILCSAFTFGLFHGNLIQSPYAFLVGLVLGYVATEYSIAWAMVLHMINNLVIADVLTRLTSGLPEMAAGLIVSAIVFVFTVGAVIVLIVKRREIGAWLRQERMERLYLKCFFSCPGIIILMVLMGLSMIVTAFLLVTPL